MLPEVVFAPQAYQHVACTARALVAQCPFWQYRLAAIAEGKQTLASPVSPVQGRSKARVAWDFKMRRRGFLDLIGGIAMWPMSAMMQQRVTLVVGYLCAGP